MATGLNKGRATELYRSLSGEYTVPEWIALFARVLAFLLNRYINED